MNNEYKITARTLRVVWDAMVDAVRGFADERRIRFRGRVLGNEAFANVAVWYFAELPRSRQEEILREYLPRLEGYLSAPESAPESAPHSSPALSPTNGAITIPLLDPPRVDSHPAILDPRSGATPPPKERGRRKKS